MSMFSPTVNTTKESKSGDADTQKETDTTSIGDSSLNPNFRKIAEESPETKQRELSQSDISLIKKTLQYAEEINTWSNSPDFNVALYDAEVTEFGKQHLIDINILKDKLEKELLLAPPQHGLATEIKALHYIMDCLKNNPQPDKNYTIEWHKKLCIGNFSVTDPIRDLIESAFNKKGSQSFEIDMIIHEGSLKGPAVSLIEVKQSCKAFLKKDRSQMKNHLLFVKSKLFKNGKYITIIYDFDPNSDKTSVETRIRRAQNDIDTALRELNKSDEKLTFSESEWYLNEEWYVAKNGYASLELESFNKQTDTQNHFI